MMIGYFKVPAAKTRKAWLANESVQYDISIQWGVTQQ